MIYDPQKWQRERYGKSPAIGNKTKGRVPGNKGKKFPPEPLTRDEVLALIKWTAFDPYSAFTSLRNQACIIILWRAGLRVSEMIKLMPRDINWEKGSLNLRHTKGNKHRVVGIDPKSLEFLKEYNKLRSEEGFSHEHPFFPSLTGKMLSMQGFSTVLKRAGKLAGIQKRVHAHGLRHTHASELADEGVDIRVIQKQLGHTNVGITDRYISHLNPKQVIDTMSNRDW